jgi:hypothetical protein
MVASNYRGKIPLPLCIKLNNMFPRGSEENEAAWLQRVKHDPLGKQMLRPTFEDFQDELHQAVAQRTTAMSDAQQIGPEAERRLGKKMLENGATVLQAGPTLIRQSADRGRLTTTIAQRYRDEFLDANGQYKHATEAYDELLEQFDASNRTPQNGSIFWNGLMNWPSPSWLTSGTRNSRMRPNWDSWRPLRPLATSTISSSGKRGASSRSTLTRSPTVSGKCEWARHCSRAVRPARYLHLHDDGTARDAPENGRQAQGKEGTERHRPHDRRHRSRCICSQSPLRRLPTQKSR